MQDATTYSVRRIGKPRRKGVTEAFVGSINAILKFDGPESPHCVYSELVALRLAQTLHIPVADGILVSTGAGEAYASLEIASPGIPLPDLLTTQCKTVASKYPEAVAALVAFDIWIGNRDRAQNIKASLITPHVPLFRGFDHSHALLNIENTARRSIGRLKGDDLIAHHHPFYGLVHRIQLEQWTARIASLPRHYIAECCQLGRTFRSVSMDVQAQLASALLSRRFLLDRLIDTHAHAICQ